MFSKRVPFGDEQQALRSLSWLWQGMMACTDVMRLTCFHLFKLQLADRIWFYLYSTYSGRELGSIEIQLWAAWLNPTRQKANESPWKNDQTPLALRNFDQIPSISWELWAFLWFWCCTNTKRIWESRGFAITIWQGWPCSIPSGLFGRHILPEEA